MIYRNGGWDDAVESWLFFINTFYKFVKLENIAVPITVEPRNCNGTTGDEDKRWNTNLIAKTVLVNHLTACAKGGNTIVKVSISCLLSLMVGLPAFIVCLVFFV